MLVQKIDLVHDYDPEQRSAYLALLDGEPVVAVSERGSIRVEGCIDEERARAIVESCIHVPTREVLSVDPPSVGELVSEVETVIRRHIVLMCDEAYSATACWVVASHFFPVFSAFPLLYIGKVGYARGGSTFLSLVMALSPRPHLLVDPTPAYIMRVVELARPTVGIDEVTKEDTRYLSTVLRLVRAGFHKGYRAGRAVGGGARTLSFNLYCPKAVVDPEGTVEQSATLSRGLRVLLARAEHKVEIPDPIKFTRMYWKLTLELYASFLTYADEVYRTYTELLDNAPSLGLSGRGVQAYAPLLAVAKLARSNIFDRVLSYVKKLDMEKPGVEMVLLILNAVLDIIETDSRVFRTGTDGRPYLDLLEVARKMGPEVRELAGRKIYTTDIEGALRQALPPGTITVEVRAKRRIAIFSRDICKTEEECRQWLINQLKAHLTKR